MRTTISSTTCCPICTGGSGGRNTHTRCNILSPCASFPTPLYRISPGFNWKIAQCLSKLIYWSIAKACFWDEGHFVVDQKECLRICSSEIQQRATFHLLARLRLCSKNLRTLKIQAVMVCNKYPDAFGGKTITFQPACYMMDIRFFCAWMVFYAGPNCGLFWFKIEYKSRTL